MDVPRIFSCPEEDHVPDWQPRTLLDLVEARSVNVNTHTALCRVLSEVFVTSIIDPPLGGSMRVA